MSTRRCQPDRKPVFPARLLERVPELRGRTQACLDGQSDPPAASRVLEEVFEPFLLELVSEGPDPALAARVFGFVEELAGDPDPAIRAVAVEATWGCFGGSPRLERIRPFLGPHTRELVFQCESEWRAANEARGHPVHAGLFWRIPMRRKLQVFLVAYPLLAALIAALLSSWAAWTAFLGWLAIGALAALEIFRCPHCGHPLGFRDRGARGRSTLDACPSCENGY